MNKRQLKTLTALLAAGVAYLLRRQLHADMRFFILSYFLLLFIPQMFLLAEQYRIVIWNYRVLQKFIFQQEHGECIRRPSVPLFRTSPCVCTLRTVLNACGSHSIRAGPCFAAANVYSY